MLTLFQKDKVAKLIRYIHRISNIEKPICIKCKYYEPGSLFHSNKFGKCLFYGKKDIVSGEIIHDYADIARMHGPCGEDGTEYIEDPYWKLKLRSKMLYKLKRSIADWCKR